LLGEELLDDEPLRDDLADSVTEEHGGFDRLAGGLDVDGMEEVVAAGDVVIGGGEVGRGWAVGRNSAPKAVAEKECAGSDGERDGE
jgi:hypothetical protein